MLILQYSLKRLRFDRITSVSIVLIGMITIIPIKTIGPRSNMMWFSGVLVMPAEDLFLHDARRPANQRTFGCCDESDR